MYLTTLDGRTSWNALISALKILISSNEDRLYIVYNNGLPLISDAFNMLHMMYHEATACHVTAELVQLLTIFHGLIRALRQSGGGGGAAGSSPDSPSSGVGVSGGAAGRSGGGGSGLDMSHILSRWKDMDGMNNRLLTLVNSFSPPELREVIVKIQAFLPLFLSLGW